MLDACVMNTGVLQLSYGDKQPGSMPWSGQGESWICWRYPHRRPVAAVLITLPPPALATSGIELLAFSAEADSFMPLQTKASAVDIGTQPGLLLVLQVNSQPIISATNFGHQSGMLLGLRVNVPLMFLSVHIR